MNDTTPAQGWSELLLALPEFILTDAHIDEHDELVADIELPRDVQRASAAGSSTCTDSTTTDVTPSVTSRSLAERPG